MVCEVDQPVKERISEVPFSDRLEPFLHGKLPEAKMVVLCAWRTSTASSRSRRTKAMTCSFSRKSPG